MTKVKDLFTESKKVLEDYKVKAEELDQQENELKAELLNLQDELTAILLDQETANVSERVYLRLSAKKINSKVEVINKLIEETDEERTALKLEFTPILKQTLANDRKVKAEYNATEIVEKYRYLMLAEIAELGKEIQGQYFSIAPEIMDIFEDSAVKERYPTIYHAFNQDQYKPSLSWGSDVVVHKNEIFTANDGRLPADLKQPKDVK